MSIDSSKVNTDTEEGKASFFEAYERIGTMTNYIHKNQNELAQFDSKILQVSNQILDNSEQLDDIQRELSLEKVNIDAMSINEDVLKQEVTYIQQQIENKGDKIKIESDGTMIWKITNVTERTYDAQSERQTSIYSPPFLTSSSGYNVCVRLYLNGDGSARGTYASIFLVILRGPYDSLVQWPFSYRVSFCLYDQRTIIEKNRTNRPKHIIESFRPDTNSISFQRPCSAMNIASGIPRFCSLNELSQPVNENLYVINDTMYIRTFIDFIGMPRSIVPSIFNINIAFPAYIQHNLLLDQLNQHETQNTN